MRFCLLNQEIYFPPVEQYGKDGLVAIGGDLNPERLLYAYRLGIFPWYNEGEPILWWSPNERAILPVDDIIISKSMRQILRSNKFHVKIDTNFEQVMRECAAPRKDREYTWINEEIIESFIEMYHYGFAHSIEVYEGNSLVGGLYGLSLGGIFFGESMFSAVSNASKYALIHLSQFCKQLDIHLIDCQIPNPHLEKMGASIVNRSEFLSMLKTGLKQKSVRGNWNDFIEMDKI